MDEAKITPKATAYAALLNGYSKRGDLAKVEKVLDRMLAAKVKPNPVTYHTLLNGYPLLALSPRKTDPPPSTPPRTAPFCPACSLRLVRRCERCTELHCGRCGWCHCFFQAAQPIYFARPSGSLAQEISEAEDLEEKACGIPPIGDLKSPPKVSRAGSTSSNR